MQEYAVVQVYAFSNIIIPEYVVQIAYSQEDDALIAPSRKIFSLELLVLPINNKSIVINSGGGIHKT
jgi:hypothetical protein